ncbi:MAG: hypothetical protein K1Y02_04655 [Candidatus Hydrogenedentes bacterium]|nr:hypothetical protein [Candidatus Hydrogenedentota bacterium]
MGRHKPAVVAFAFSAALHLSMVTVFTIYIDIPVPRLRYYTFDIVNPTTHESYLGPIEPDILPDASLRETLRLDTGVQPLADVAESIPAGVASEFPTITLPTWAVPELERLQLRQESLRLRAEFTRKQKQSPFSFLLGESGFLRETLGRITDSDDETAAPPTTSAILVGRPVEGVVMYIEWMADPRNREILFSPPVESLWRLGPSSLQQPLSLLFKVAATGEVTEVLTPIEDDNELAASAGKALLKYRFAPLLEGGEREQYGTLIIAPESKDSP